MLIARITSMITSVKWLIVRMSTAFAMFAVKMSTETYSLQKGTVATLCATQNQLIRLQQKQEDGNGNQKIAQFKFNSNLM